MAGHFVELGDALLRPAQLHQLDLLELVLADHPAGVATGRTGLGAEAHRVRGHPDRQRGAVDDLVADQVGQRHFRGRNQVAQRLTGGAEQVLLEFRQLAGALQGLRQHQQRHVDLGVAMRAGVQVQHELRQRPMQPGDRTLQHGEARTRQLGGTLAVQPVVQLPQLDVIAHREIEDRRRADLAQHHVAALVGPGRYAALREVRHPQQDRLQPGLHLAQPLLQRLQPLRDRGAFGEQFAGIATLGLQLADLLGQRIAARLQLLRLDLHLLARGLQ